MSRHLFVVLTSPTAGMEEEFNDWYTNKHLSDVLQLESYVSAQRYRYVPKSADDVPYRPYLAIYETETDDVQATQRRLTETVDTPAMEFSPAIDRSQSIGWYYEPITDRRTP
jgi:hypothetical protein